MDAMDLSSFFPKLYHMTAVENWETIQQYGLLSTSKLLDRFEVEDDRRFRLEYQRRPDSEILKHDVYGQAILRDNIPLIESRLKSCLQDGLTPKDWYAILNRRVFFWPTQERVMTLLNAAAYRSSHQLVIEVSTERLVTEYRDRIELSPMNSGATRPVAHPRGLGTFTALEEYDFEKWRRRRGPTRAVVEVTVLDAVEQLTEIATLVVRYDPTGTEEVVWRRQDRQCVE